MIRLMGRVCIFIWMVLSTMVIGEKTNNMVMEWKHGQMAPSMKGTMNMGRSMVQEPLNGLITHSILVNSITTIYMVRESIHGATDDDTRVNGRTIRCTGRERSPGLMVGSMLVSMLRTRSRVMESLFGLMVDLIKVIGTMGSNMGREYMLHPRVQRSMGNGRRERG